MKDPQFTLTLAKAIQNAEIPVTYDLLTYKGTEQGVFPVLGVSAIAQPTGFERFPIFDEAYRKVLVGKIVDRYWNYEIGLQSADMFWNAVRRWLNMNMPYFNELYKSVDFDLAMKTVDISTTVIGVNDVSQTSSSTNKTSSKSEQSGKSFDNQMPQTEMSENENYATGATETSGKSSSSGEGNDEGKSRSKGVDTTESQTTGFQGSQSDLLAAFRANIINVDNEIVTAMRPLFMLVWKNAETATRGEYLRGLL